MKTADAVGQLDVSVFRGAEHEYACITSPALKLDVRMVPGLSVFDSLLARAQEKRTEAKRLLQQADLMEEAITCVGTLQWGAGYPQDKPVPLGYDEPGHICQVTQRVAMTVAAAFTRESLKERSFWLHTSNAAEPWRWIEGFSAKSYKSDSHGNRQPRDYVLHFSDGQRFEGAEWYAVVYMDLKKKPSAVSL